jgi:homoserine kinase type II
MRRAAALRFWLLRLEASLRPRAGQVVTVKDPGYFEALLERLRLAAPGLPR